MKKLHRILLATAVMAMFLAPGWGQVTIRVVESNQRIDPALQGPLNTGWVDAIKGFEKANPGIKVQVIEIPSTGNGSDAWTKIDIMTASGDNFDVVDLPNPVRYTKYVNAGFLAPLGPLAKDIKWDLDKDFGRFLKKYNNNVYWIPREFSPNIVYYNKKIFDDANVPYPKADWTWADYAATAKKLTDTKKGIWGSLFQQWEYLMYVGPQQDGVSPYKADGTSNFDNPAYAKWLQFYADLGKNKAQPDWTEMTNKKYQWDSFMSGKFGMTFVGTWHLGLFADSKNYPRDWKFGVVTAPGASILSSGSALGINKNAKYPKEAMLFIKYLSDTFGKDYAQASYVARADLTPDALKKRFETDAKRYASDGVTAEDLSLAIMNPTKGSGDEKISGPGSGGINSLFVSEGEKFLVGGQSLADTIKNLKKKSDDAIAKEKSAN